MTIPFATDCELAARLRAVEEKLRTPDLLTSAEQLADELAEIIAVLDPEPAT